MPTQTLRISTGPWCGAVTANEVIVKASVMRNVTQVRLIVAEDPALVLSRKEFPAVSLWSDPEQDYKGKLATCRASGLNPATQYHYGLELDGVVQGQRIGKFRTLPAPGTAADFRFAFGSCSSNFKWRLFTGGLSPEAFVVIPQENDLLFFLHLGDFYYDIDDREISGRLEKYDRVLERPELRDFFLALPFAYVWDDHDFLGNNAEGGTEENRPAARTAMEAYDLYMPHYEFVPGNDGIYQSFIVGRVLFLMTDSRFNRSPRKASGTSGKTILGKNQKVWLKQKLIEGKSLDLIVWANSVPWIGEEEAKSDYWAGYSAERKEISEFIKAQDVRNLCMISGDAHMVAIDDGSHSGFAEPDATGNRGGFPVFHAASLESKPSEKAGPYSIGSDDGGEGPGIPGRRQYGLFELKYVDGVPRVFWTGKRARKGSADVNDAEVLMRYEFAGNATHSGF